MSEKRFTSYYERGNEVVIEDNGKRLSNKQLVKLLNEQQELIEELHISDHMGWGRAEKFEKELKQKKIYIKRLEYKVQKFKEENEQLRRLFEEMKQPITINLTEEDEKELRKLLGLIDDE